MKFTYPKPLQQGDTIGVTAPSSGIGKFTARYEYVKASLQERGFTIVEGKCLLDDKNSVSGTPQDRARDFMDLWLSPDVDAILPPWGGELLIQILEHVDFDLLKSSTPKWCMGYSDISLLLAALTFKTGVVTAHGTNLLEMGGSQTERLTKEALKPLQAPHGSEIVQESAEKYIKGWPRFLEEPEAPTQFTEPVQWKTLGGDPVQFAGRAIGGCLDVIVMIAGTCFDGMDSFKAHAGDEGVVLYLENCEQSKFQLLRTLCKLKYAGWFEGLNGVVLGRDATDFGETDDYHDTVTDFFEELAVPFIYDADIGHRQPNLTILNGALVEFYCDGRGAGRLTTRKEAS